MGEDRTLPLPAPEGMKWVVHLSRFTDSRYELGLFPEDAEVDQYGYYERLALGRRHTTIRDSSQFHACFDRDMQIRRASQEILRQVKAQRDADAELTALRSRFS